MAERGSLEQVLLKALLLAGALWVLYRSLSVVVVTLLAVIIAAALMPVADLMEKRRVPRAVTVAAVYVVGLGLAVLFAVLLAPVVAEQARLIAARLPAVRDRIHGWLDALRAATGRFGPAGEIRLPDIGPEQIAPIVENVARRSLAFTRNVFTFALNAFLVLFVSAYTVIDRKRIAEGLLAFVPPARRRDVARVAAAVFDRMGGYARGQLAVSACIGLLLSIGLAIVGIDAPLLIGVTAGALNLVPFLGSTIALLLALLIAVNQSTLAILGVLAVFAAVQFLEGYVFSPFFLGRNLDLHPLAVLAALLIGAQVAGLIGVVLAVPILAGLNAFLQQTWIRSQRD
ncbi:MAG: AI-2E family transporter [Candidatus Polarisedimenticolia bacterium]